MAIKTEPTGARPGHSLPTEQPAPDFDSWELHMIDDYQSIEEGLEKTPADSPARDYSEAQLDAMELNYEKTTGRNLADDSEYEKNHSTFNPF
ncbi:MAG: hypothetical protein AAF621_07085 [Pseudomonadota bacterium]